MVKFSLLYPHETCICIIRQYTTYQPSNMCYTASISLLPSPPSLTNTLSFSPSPPPSPLSLSHTHTCTPFFPPPPSLPSQVMKVDNTKYTILYSIYSWPNVILSIFGGFLLDRVFGIRIGTVIFSALICIGQFVFALGGIVDKFWVMIVGRFIFG